jgi:hypothetical protein
MSSIANNQPMNPNGNNQAGKGDKPRPVDIKVFGQNYDEIFRKQSWPNDPETFESEDHDNNSNHQHE